MIEQVPEHLIAKRIAIEAIKQAAAKLGIDDLLHPYPAEDSQVWIYTGEDVWLNPRNNPEASAIVCHIHDPVVSVVIYSMLDLVRFAQRNELRERTDKESSTVKIRMGDWKDDNHDALRLPARKLRRRRRRAEAPLYL